jgi:hypothetical protein
MSNSLTIANLINQLESFYGPQQITWPTDPYLFLVWWHCGYPASDTACAKGWASLTKTIGTAAEALLAASPEKLASALKPGGMVPELEPCVSNRSLRASKINSTATSSPRCSSPSIKPARN